MRKLIYLFVLLLMLYPAITFGAENTLVDTGHSAFPDALDAVGGTACTTACFDATDAQTFYDDHWDTVCEAILALETKVGYTDSNAADNQVLTGTGAGTSAWGSVEAAMVAADVATQAELDAVSALYDTAGELLAIMDDTALDFGTGVITATGFVGPLTGAVTGNADTATLAATSTLVDSTDTTAFPIISDTVTGDHALKTDAALTYNASTGSLAATILTDGTASITSGAATGMTGIVSTGTVDFGGASQLEIPNVTDASTVVDAVGEMAVETDVEQFWVQVDADSILKIDITDCTSGEVMEMGGAGAFICATDDTAGDPALNTVGDPAAATSWTADAAVETVTFTSDVDDTVNWWTIQNSSATQSSGQTYLLNLDHSAANQADTDADFLLCQDVDGEVASIQSDGNINTIGTLTVGGDTQITDTLKMTTNTDTYVLVADGTDFSPVAMSGDVAIDNAGATTIQADSVALTTDTSGNYTATIADAGNTTITVVNGTAEGGAVTLDAVDLNCTDCINATEIEDIYVSNAGSDVMAGTLTADGLTLGDDEVLTVGGFTVQNDVASGDDQLLITTTNTSATATDDPLVEILVGTSPTANQEVFGVSKGTQGGENNTNLLALDEDGDLTINGNFTQTGTEFNIGAKDDAMFILDAATASESDWWVGINNDSEGDDDDSLEIRQSATPGSSVELEIQPDGDVLVTGSVTGKQGLIAQNGSTGAGFVNFSEDSDNGANAVTIIGPASTADITLTLPSSVGNSGEVLSTDGGTPATLSWAAAGSGDVSSVGPVGATGCVSGACYDGTSDGGQLLLLYDGDSHALTLDAIDLSGAHTVTLPGITGTVAMNDDATGIVKFAGPTQERTYTLPDANASFVNSSGGGDVGDNDITSIDKLEGVNTGMYIDMGTDGNGIEMVDNTKITATAPSIVLTGAVTGVTTLAASDAITLSDGLTIDQSANNVLSLAENSEDIEFTFGSDAMTVASTTGVASLDFGTIDLATDALDVSAGGITNAGAISGGTTFDASGTVTGGTLTDGTASISSGAASGLTSVSVDASADPQIILDDSTHANNDGSIVSASVDANDATLTLNTKEDTALTPYITLEGVGETVDVLKPLDVTGYVNSSGSVTANTDLVATSGDVSVGDDILLANGAVVGITGNEVMTFNSAGSINFTGATVDVDGAFTASSVASDGAVSGTTITGTDKISTTATTEQLRLNYDATNYLTATVGSDGDTTITTVDSDGAAGNLTFSPDGTIILTPATDVVGALTADSVASDGAVSGTTGTFTGDLTGNLKVTTTTADTLVVTAAECRGVMHVNGDADVIDYTLPTAAAGLNCCFYGGGNAGVITVDTDNTSDIIFLDGVALTAGYSIDSPGAVSDYICLIAVDDVNWHALGKSGTWIDGGA